MSPRLDRAAGGITVEPHHKGFPASAVGREVGELVGLGLGLADGLGTPVLLLRQDALEHNLQAMRDFCDRHGLSLSPHVKTSMSPEIIGAQLAAGAWAVTVATPTQLRTLRWLGARRILLANQLVDPAAVDWLGAELDRDPAFTGYCYVDSAAGVDLLARALAARGQRRRLPVLVELGLPGGRTGARTVDEAAALAGLVHRSPLLELAGVGGFEGIIDIGLDPDRLDEVAGYLRRLRQLVDRTSTGDGRSGGEVGGEVGGEFVVTVGGSAFFELVPDLLDPAWRGGRPIRVVLRSGCYVTHDSGAYQRLRSLVSHRYDPLALTPALELWARVLSRPEPELAIADFGRRDTGTDAGYPVPEHVIRPSFAAMPEPAPPAEVVRLDDQHAYLRSAAGSLPLEVGDLVGFGISHPCTTLDKWRLVPVVDPSRRLVGAARTLF